MLDQAVLDYIDAHAEEAYELLVTLAQIPAPSNHEEKRMEFCKSWLAACGAKGVYTDSALNVIYPWGVEEDGPVVVFMAHTDVVFPDTTSLPLKVEGDHICCPGIGDDTANLAALLLAAKYVTEKRLKPEGPGILFVCNAGEEGLGNLKGSRKICEDYAGRIKAFYSFDGTMDGVVNRAVGSARFQVTVRTKGGHSYGCFGCPNAIGMLARIISGIYEIQTPKEGKTTYNVGTIQGGTSVNTIAQEAVMLCEYRSDREEGLAYMKEKFQELFHASLGEGVEVETKVVGLRPCEHLEEEQEETRLKMVEEACERLKRITGREPKRGPSSTDCNIPLSMGIPSVCFGAYFGDGAHTREEYVERSSLKAGYQVVFESILSYFNK